MRVLQIAVLVAVLVPFAGAAGPTFQLPVKPKNNIHFWRTAPEPMPLVTNEGELNPGANQPPGHNILVNQDFNFRAQNETSIAVDPNDPKHIVVGYNDYRTGTPVGGGFSTSFDGGKSWHDGLVTHPLLTAPGDFPDFVEPPIGTGDPAVGFRKTANTAHQITIGFSASFCENGIFSHNSPNGGISWARPIVSTGAGIVAYWPYAFDCSVVLDKEYVAVDNTGGPHDGRLYVTYTRFFFEGGASYLESPIYLAYSDDGGASWSDAGEINSSSADLCEYQEDTTGGTGPGATGPDATTYDCDENQFSYPVVGSDGAVYVHFFNEQNESEWSGPSEFDDQILVVKVDPDTFDVDGPFQVDMLSDGVTNYPLSPFNGRQTVCNGGWRLNAAGNIAVGPNDELYVTWADNRNGDEFPAGTFVSASDGSCSGGLHTSTDVFVSKSTDGGETWSEPMRVTKDPANSDNWFPWVAVSNDGRVGIVYYDRRLSDNSTTATDAWIALSKDGGKTWKESRASEKSSNFFTAFFGTPSFIGDYNGLAFAGKNAMPFWTQGVGNDSDVYLGVVQPGGK
jgi:hypothetical protein